MKKEKIFATIVILASLIFISAVSSHSVQEIHYLKSFFPKSFTVEEAKAASIIELIKVILISLPLIILMVLSLLLLNKNSKK